VYIYIIYTHTHTYIHNKYRHVRIYLLKYINTVTILQ